MPIKISNVLKTLKRAELVTITLLISLSPVLTLLMPVGASAAPTFNYYPLPVNTLGFNITSGPDGALWTIDNSNNIFRVSTTGDITTYPLPSPYGNYYGITSGSDGALWYTETSKSAIGRLTTSGAFTEYPVSLNSSPGFITTGPDGALWFTEISGDRIGRLSTTGSLNEYQILNPHDSQYGESAPYGITTGPDGALWYTEALANKIGRMTTSGVATEYSIPTADSYPVSITTGPDGALWFTEAKGDKIGRISTSGAITEYPIRAYSYPYGITTGPDGAIWFAEYDSSAIGRITPSGAYTEYSASSPRYITTGPDGALWFTVNSAAEIGRMTLPTPAAPSNLTAPSPAQNPILTWDGVNGADSYNVYRNGVEVGASNSPSYTDTTAPEGTNTYYVTAVNGGGESTPSNGVSVVVDRTAPSVSNLGFTTDPLSTGQQTSLNASITDNLSGVTRAEYYTGIDPGAGNGTAMTLVNGTATAPVGPYSTAGMYTYYVRAQDNAGNWSQPQSVTLDVYNPSGGYTAGHGFVSPGSASSSPGDYLPDVSGSNVKATFDFTVKYDTATATTPTGASTFSWGSGNCKKAGNSCFVVTADSLDWLVVPGDNTAVFQGTGTVSLNGQTLGTDYVVRISVVGTTTTSLGHYELQVFTSRANPDTATPLYQASGDLTGGAVVLHA